MSANDTVLVTGGAGFIGSAVVRRLVLALGRRVVNVDKLTYAGHRESLAAVAGHRAHHFVHADVADADRMRALFDEFAPAAVLHLAAESHVDRSVDAPAGFLRTNVEGTFVLLQEALRHFRRLNGADRDRFRFVHVSTDEVFGSLGSSGRFTETTPYDPRSPYSASKAASDHFVRAWHHTYGLPTIVTNCSNNYGPFQFPEKLIPLMILKALAGDPLPVYGTGANVRDWLYVEDHVDALLLVLERGRPGEGYVVGGSAERTNLDVARALCGLVDALAPDPDAAPRERLITFVEDRPGHDMRYAVDASRIERELGWRPRESFDTGLRKTVAWYLANAAWCAAVRARGYDGGRLGLGTPGAAGAVGGA